MNPEVITNHKEYLARKNLYLQHGYDVDKEREFVLEKARPFDGTILEAGTGKGHFSIALAREGYNFTSFDISEMEQNYARLNLMYYGLENHVRLEIANAESLDYQDNTFNTVFSVNMFHHVVSGEKVCDELLRVLTATGKLVISDFNDKGFAMIESIHAMEGRHHEVSPVRLANLLHMLLSRDLEVEYYTGINQDTLVAFRRGS